MLTVATVFTQFNYSHLFWISSIRIRELWSSVYGILNLRRFVVTIMHSSKVIRHHAVLYVSVICVVFWCVFCPSL